MKSCFYECLMQDLRALFRSRAQWLNPILFFAILISLFGIGLGAEINQLAIISPAIIWIAFLLTSLLTIETMFRLDQEEGILEQLLLSPIPLWWLLLAKSLALWITTCLPLILIMPLLGLSLQLSSSEVLMLVLSLLVGSPALTLMGMIGAALTISLPRSGIFLALLCLPLYVPILILGESTLVSLLSSQWPLFQMAMLGAISVLSITLAPFAIAAALRVGMDE